jgi:hypothetical protein
MKPPSPQNGQALTEMALVIPILCLMAAGLIQFTQLFLAKNTFEQACGLAARDYAAGEIDDTQFNQDAWENLGEDQRNFIPGSISAVPIPGSSSVANLLTNNLGVLGPLLSKIKSVFVNYTGKKWLVTIQFKGPPFFGLLFPGGLTFQTQLAVLKYPEVQTP